MATPIPPSSSKSSLLLNASITFKLSHTNFHEQKSLFASINFNVVQRAINPSLITCSQSKALPTSLPSLTNLFLMTILLFMSSMDLALSIVILLPPFTLMNIPSLLRSSTATYLHMTITFVAKLLRLTYRFLQQILLNMSPPHLNAALNKRVSFQHHLLDVATPSLNNLRLRPSPMEIIPTRIEAPIHVATVLLQNVSFALSLAILPNISLRFCNATTHQWPIMLLLLIIWPLAGCSTLVQAM